MRLIHAWLMMLAVVFIQGWGILLAMRGNPCLLSVSVIADLVAFARLACSQGTAH